MLRHVEQDRRGDVIGQVAHDSQRCAQRGEVELERIALVHDDRRGMEALAESEGRLLSSYSLEEQEQLWIRVKRTELQP